MGSGSGARWNRGEDDLETEQGFPGPGLLSPEHAEKSSQGFKEGRHAVDAAVGRDHAGFGAESRLEWKAE